jgi:excisionase family DNA binding protein
MRTDRSDPVSAQVSVRVGAELLLNGVMVRVPFVLGEEALATIAAALEPAKPEPSPYMTIVEAAAYLRCPRQRIDDLLSQRRLARYKDGARTLVSRAEVEEHLRKHRR